MATVYTVISDTRGEREFTSMAEAESWAMSYDRMVERRPLTPCPACKRPHDSTRIPPPRVPMDIRCACCCNP